MKLDAAYRKIVTCSHQALLGLAIVFGWAGVATSQGKISLDSTEKPICQLVHTTLKADGNLKVTPGDEADETPIRVTGELRYSDVSLASAAAPRSARWYEKAQAEISVGGRVDKSQLKAERRLMVVQRRSNEITYFSPQGPLTRGDLELISTQFDPMVVRQLLKGRSVEKNETWKPDNQSLADLFGLDLVGKSSIECKLLSATDEMAQVQITGDVEGTALGAKSTLKVDGTITFDRSLQGISRIAVSIHEERDVGLFAPGFQMEAHIDTTLSPAKTPKELRNDVISKFDQEPTASNLAIEFTSPAMGVAFLHDRQWRATLHRRDLLVLRMVDDGSFVAQCNMTPAAKAGDDSKADKEKFQAHVEQALAQNGGQIDEISTATREGGLRILRIAASGKAKEVPITWVYYMLTDPTGQRMALVFTFATAQQKNFKTSDHDLIGSLKFFDKQRAAQRDAAGHGAR